MKMYVPLRRSEQINQRRKVNRSNDGNEFG